MGFLSILAMRCPICGGNLESKPADKVFPCLNCKKYFEVREGSFVERELITLKTINEFKGDMIFYAPTWEFDVETRVDAKPEEREDAEKAASSISKVYVSAFRMWRPGYFGIPGNLYTLSQIKHVAEDRELNKPLILGCGRSMKDAIEFVKPALLLAIDRKIDVAFINVSGEIKGARLLAVPYIAMGEKVYDTQLKWEYPLLMFEDLADFAKV